MLASVTQDRCYEILNIVSPIITSRWRQIIWHLDQKKIIIKLSGWSPFRPLNLRFSISDIWYLVFNPPLRNTASYQKNVMSWNGNYKMHVIWMQDFRVIKITTELSFWSMKLRSRLRKIRKQVFKFYFWILVSVRFFFSDKNVLLRLLIVKIALRIFGLHCSSTIINLFFCKRFIE